MTIITGLLLVVIVGNVSAAGPLGIIASSTPNISTVNTSVFSCNPILLANQVSKFDLLSIINDTAEENRLGACSLAALNYYNSSGTLAANNVSANITALTTNFFSKNPNLTTVYSNNVTNAFSTRPNVLCIVTPSFQSSTNRLRTLNCVAIPASQAFDCNFANMDYSYNNSIAAPDCLLQKFDHNLNNALDPSWWNSSYSLSNFSSQRKNVNSKSIQNIVKPLFFSYSIPSNVTAGPHVIFIPRNINGSIIFSVKNNTLIVVDTSNSTQVHELPPSAVPSDPTPTVYGYPNWAGYAVISSNYSQDTFYGISGSWIVQPALESSSSRLSLQWIGLGGAVQGGSKIIQVGTSSCYLSPTLTLSSLNCALLGPNYHAFYELYPNTAVLISNFYVHPGDKMVASINYLLPQVSGGIGNMTPFIPLWHITIQDLNDAGVPAFSTNQTFNVTTYSAEWIDERPGLKFLNKAYLSNLTNFVDAKFLSANATLWNNPFKSVNLTDLQNLYQIYMVNTTSAGYITDFGDNLGVSNISGASAFTIYNFRIGNPNLLQQNIIAGQSTKITLYTSSQNDSNVARFTVPSALGGTGLYTYKWLWSTPPGSSVNGPYVSISNCSTGYGSPTCTLTPSTAGTYYVKIVAGLQDGPFNETLTSSPTKLVVTAPIPSYPISINNYQSIATSIPFQQMLVIDSAVLPGINSNWNNVEFTMGAGATGTPLQAWVESNASSSSTHTIVWVNLPYSISGYGSTTIYMNVMPTPVMSSGGPTGEAPQLSPTYAEYDNGASVFNFYDNFRGTSLSSAWTHTTNAAISVNNGLGITFSGLDAYIVTNSHYGVGTAFDSDITYFEDNSYLSANSTNETDPDDMGYININQPQSAIGNSGWSATMIRAACNNLYPTQINPSGETNSCGRVFGAFAYGYIPIGIYTVNPITSSSSLQYVGYSTSGTRQPITGDAPSYPASVGYAQMSYGPYTNRITAQWVRVRNAPPNGVMPTASGLGII